jgi:hypothetical protein
MALRAVPDHPKFADLKARLGRPKYVALGCLEAIWHFTGRFTPQGNLGKYTDQAIEAWVEWDGEPGALIAALVGAGWLDADPVHRLLVHDWAQHADKATKNALGRAHVGFCTDPVRTASVQSTDEKPESGTVSRLPEPVPVPVPVPVPEPETKAKTKAATPKAPLFVLPDWISKEVWAAFEEMRRKIKKPMTDHARNNIVADLVRIEATGQHAEDVLNQSITNDWRGVFPLTTANGGSNGRGGGSFGNRGQARTNGNLEALKASLEGSMQSDFDRTGGSPASIRERGDVEAVLRPSV